MTMAVLDIDGPVADFDLAACARFGEGRGRELYSLEERYPDRADEVRKWANDPGTYATLEPVVGARDGLAQITRDWPGLMILAVTARPLGSEDITYAWLARQHFLAFLSGITTVPFNKKPKVISGMNPVVAFEDSPYQAGALAALRVPVILISKPYNFEMGDGITRRTWSEIPPIMAALRERLMREASHKISGTAKEPR